MNLLDQLKPYRVLIETVAVAAATGLLIYNALHWLHLRDAAHEKVGADRVQLLWDADTKARLAAAIKAQADNAAETLRRLTDQQKATDEALKQRDAALADLAAAGTRDRQLRSQLALYVAAARNSGAGCNPTPAGAGAPAEDPAGVLADLFGRADDRAGILAAALDASRIAGQACERAYDALTAEP